MVIKYTNNNEDMKQKAYFNTVNSPEYDYETGHLVRLYRIFAILLIGWGLIQIVMYYTGDRNDVEKMYRAFTFPCMGLVMYLFAVAAPAAKRFFTKLSVNRKYNRNVAEYPETVITIDSKNLTCTSGNLKESHKLTEEMDVYETKDCYLIDLKKNQIVLPKRALNEESMAELEHMFKLKSRLAKAEEKLKEKKKEKK